MKRDTTTEHVILDPDPNNLVDEWAHQPKLYREWATLLAKARKTFRRRKAELKLIEASLDAKIRKNPKKFGLTKLSEPAIERTVTLQREFQDAEKSLNKAQYKVEVLEGVVESVDERKWALQNIVALYGDDYTAEPTAKPKNREALASKLKQSARKKTQE